MKATIIGCGNASSFRNFNQTIMLEENGKRLLIDDGYRTPLALQYHNIDLKSIDGVYVSHQHGDHVGGLEELALLRYDWKNHPRHFSEGAYAPKLIANTVLMDDLWEHTLSGGLRTMEGFDAELATFFEPIRVLPNKPFYWEGWRFDLVQQIHVMTGSVFMNTFGLFMSKEGHKSIFFTTDCQYMQPEQVMVFYKKADIIIQDCELIGCDTKTKMYRFGTGVHAPYAKLAGWDSANAMKMAPEIKAKLWLSHYQDFLEDGKDGFGNDCDWNALAKEDGITNGFVRVGQVFEV